MPNRKEYSQKQKAMFIALFKQELTRVNPSFDFRLDCTSIYNVSVASTISLRLFWFLARCGGYISFEHPNSCYPKV